MDPIQLAQTKTRYKEERKKRLRSDGNAQFIQRRKGQAPETLQIRSKFVTIATGVLNWPKLAKIPGILDYQGDMFHFLPFGRTMLLVDPLKSRRLPD